MAYLNVQTDQRDDTDGLLVALHLDSEDGSRQSFGLVTGKSVTLDVPAGQYRPRVEMPNGELLDCLYSGYELTVRDRSRENSSRLRTIDIAEGESADLQVIPTYRSPREFLNFAYGSRSTVQASLRPLETYTLAVTAGADELQPENAPEQASEESSSSSYGDAPESTGPAPREFVLRPQAEKVRPRVGIRLWEKSGTEWIHKTAEIWWNDDPAIPGVIATVENLDGNSPKFLEIASDVQPPRLAAVPAGQADAKALIYLREESDEPIQIAMFPRNGVAEGLLNYLHDGNYDAIRATETAAAERLFMAKYVDYVGATVGAYALARVGQLPRYVDWLINLTADFPKWADPWILLSMIATRSDFSNDVLRKTVQTRISSLWQGTRATDYLDEAGLHGAPMFTEGLRFVADRLADPRWQPSKGKSILAGYADAADWSCRITTFRGSHPDHPEIEPAAATSFDGYVTH